MRVVLHEGWFVSTLTIIGLVAGTLMLIHNVHADVPTGSYFDPNSAGGSDGGDGSGCSDGGTGTSGDGSGCSSGGDY